MRLSLDSIEVLDAIDRQGSFAAAAEVLHRVPSAVTYAVQKLEEDLDVQIFDRRGHRALLTEAGRELLGEGRRLLSAAGEIESRVKRVASGYEVELRIAIDGLIPIDRFLPVLDEFYRVQCGTRIRLTNEIYGGMWDALVSDRADLVIGAPGEGPPGGGFSTRPLGLVEFIFLVAPVHPLAKQSGPLKNEEIVKYRAVSVADTSRHLPPRTSGLLSGQDVLTVPWRERRLRRVPLFPGRRKNPSRVFPFIWHGAPDIVASRYHGFSNVSKTRCCVIRCLPERGSGCVSYCPAYDQLSR